MVGKQEVQENIMNNINTDHLMVKLELKLKKIRIVEKKIGNNKKK